MKIAVLDAATLGDDLDLSPLSGAGEPCIYRTTAPSEIPERIADAEVVIINKVKLGREALAGAEKLKLICVAATGFDNIDTAYCEEQGIAVANVRGYSTDSVCQVTVAMALYLTTHIPEYTSYVRSGDYTDSGVANRLVPPYRELAGKTWGVIGFGNIGKKVAAVASAFGCRVLVCRRSDAECEYTVTDADTICREADIISVHTPLNDGTRNLVNKERIALMKKSAVVINAARGAVVDEAELASAVRDGRIGGLGSDVYTAEPFPETHPYFAVKELDNVCLTPHMAWGAVEARERLLREMILNIKAFYSGERRNRIV